MKSKIYMKSKTLTAMGRERTYRSRVGRKRRKRGGKRRKAKETDQRKCGNMEDKVEGKNGQCRN